jgi:hypothetical protein
MPANWVTPLRNWDRGYRVASCYLDKDGYT